MKKRKSKFKPILITMLICLIWINLKYEEKILSNELSHIQLEKEKLIEHINKLENDISYIEFLAYSKYKMVKPGEKIFRVKNTKKID